VVVTFGKNGDERASRWRHGVLVFLFFVRFLNVGLPAGWLQPILGTAGT